MNGPLNGVARRIAWSDPLAEPPIGPPEVLRPKVGSEVEIILLDAQAVVVWLHWTGRRSVPHLTGPEGCPLCITAEPAKQWAYISAYVLHGARVALAELTAYALSRCPEIVAPSEARPLRGRHALLARSPGHRSARCTIRLLQATYGRELPPGLNVRATLELLWATDPVSRQALGLDPSPTCQQEEPRDDG